MSDSPVVPAVTFPEPFSLDTRFFQRSFSEYLRKNHLSHILFYELPIAEQRKVIARAQEFKDRRKSVGHEGAIE